MNAIRQLDLLNLTAVPVPNPRTLCWCDPYIFMPSYLGQQNAKPGQLVRFNNPLTDLADQTIFSLPSYGHAMTDCIAANDKVYVACQPARTSGGTLIFEVDPQTGASAVVCDNPDYTQSGPGPRICVGGGKGWGINYGPGDGTGLDDKSTLMQFTEDFRTLLQTRDVMGMSRGNGIAYDPVHDQIIFTAEVDSVPGMIGRAGAKWLDLHTVNLNADERMPSYHGFVDAQGNYLVGCETSATLLTVAPDLTITRTPTLLPGQWATWGVWSDGASLWMAHPLGPGSPSLLTQIAPNGDQQLWSVTKPVGGTVNVGNVDGMVFAQGCGFLAFSAAPKSAIARFVVPQ